MLLKLPWIFARINIMKKSILSIVALVLVLGSLSLAGARPFESNRDFYIVELTDYTGKTEISSMLITSQHEGFKTMMVVKFPDVRVNAEYRTLLSGFSLEMTPQEAKDMSMVEDVKSVVKGRVFYPHMFNSVVSTKADKAWELKDPKGKGLDGSGVLVGIIDTGINYDHPSLGNGFANGDSKVVVGYDFSDLDADPMPVAGHQGWHGTHCAGIVAGNGLPGIARNDRTITGMAPGAKLGAYKVFGNVGGARTDRIMQAMERAYQDGCKVVSMSLGSTYVWADEIYCRMIDRLTDKGVVFSVSAGNDGGGSREDLPFQVGSPGGADSAICVAAMDDTPKPVISWASDKAIMNYLGGSPTVDETLSAPLADAASGYENDVKNLDLTGKIALVKRGDKYFSDKAIQVQKKGAVACIIYNNEPGDFGGYLVDAVDIPVLGVSDTVGAQLLETAKSGGTASISEQKYLGAMADFSSAGPTNDYRLKPDVSAPGVNVLSSVGSSAYVEMSGTSMACPTVSGLAALVIQAHPDWTAHDVRSAVINYADPQADLKGNPWSIHSQGTGRINSVSSINAPALFKPTSLNFGKVTGSTEFKLIIKNPTSKTVKFNVSVYSEDGIVTGDVKPVEIAAKKSVEYKGTLKVSSQEGLVHVGYVVFDNGDTKARIGFLLLTNDPPTPPTIDKQMVMTPVFSPNGDKKLDRFIAQFSVNKMLDGFEWDLLDEDDNLVSVLDYSYGLQGGGFWFLTWSGIVENVPLEGGKYKMAVYTLDRNKDPRIQANWEKWGPIEFFVVDEQPEITIEKTPEVVFNTNEITLKGSISDWIADADYLGAKGFVSVDTIVNGNKSKLILDPSGNFETVVPLVPGKNQIQVGATNAGMIRAEKDIKVNCLKRISLSDGSGKVTLNDSIIDVGDVKVSNNKVLVAMDKLSLLCPDLSLNQNGQNITIIVDDKVAKMRIGQPFILNGNSSVFCEAPVSDKGTTYIPVMALFEALGGQFTDGTFWFVWRGN